MYNFELINLISQMHWSLLEEFFFRQEIIEQYQKYSVCLFVRLAMCPSWQDMNSEWGWYFRTMLQA